MERMKAEGIPSCFWLCVGVSVCRAIWLDLCAPSVGMQSKQINRRCQIDITLFSFRLFVNLLREKEKFVRESVCVCVEVRLWSAVLFLSPPIFLFLLHLRIELERGWWKLVEREKLRLFLSPMWAKKPAAFFFYLSFSFLFLDIFIRTRTHSHAECDLCGWGWLLVGWKRRQQGTDRVTIERHRSQPFVAESLLFPLCPVVRSFVSGPFHTDTLGPSLFPVPRSISFFFFFFFFSLLSRRLVFVLDIPLSFFFFLKRRGYRSSVRMTDQDTLHRHVNICSSLFRKERR